MFENPTERRILRWPEVHRKVTLSRQYVARLERQNCFPRRVQLGPQSVGWFSDEIDRWLEERQRGPIDLSRQFTPRRKPR